MNFKDYFSGHSIDYARFRPTYPAELFEYLASLAPQRETAWDCATGNGQAARGLAPFFARVIATDASSAQLAHAMQHEKIEYRFVPAEATDIAPASIDLITVAQAFHWLDHEAFYREAKRTLKAGGALALWCYILLEIEPEIDRIITHFYSVTVGPYWSPERALVEDGYRSLPFPFRELAPPRFLMRARWSLPELLGYLGTWSATQYYIRERGHDPVKEVAGELLALWPEPEEEKEVRWPLSLRVGVN